MVVWVAIWLLELGTESDAVLPSFCAARPAHALVCPAATLKPRQSAQNDLTLSSSPRSAPGAHAHDVPAPVARESNLAVPVSFICGYCVRIQHLSSSHIELLLFP